MKLNKNRLYLYPVLHELRDDYLEDSKFSVVIEAKQRTTSVDLSVTFTVNDNLIEQYIREEKFLQIVHVECPKTKLRTIHRIKSDEIKIDVSIPSGLLNGVVEISPMIISNYTGPYYNPNFSDDYNGLDIELSIGNIVAYDDTRYFYVEKDRMEYVDVESVFVLNRTKNNHMIIDVTSGDKIVVDLPNEIYASYFALDDEINRTISLQMIIYPAVIKALEMLANEETRSHVKHKKWYLTFKNQLAKYDYDIDSNSLSDMDEKYVAAQKLLEDPLLRSYIELTKLQEGLS